MHKGSWVFVGLVYGALAVSFLLTTGIMIWEFWFAGWLDHLTTHSHLFLFFPTFGVIALLAFAVPAALLTDIYTGACHIRHGRIRFTIGALVLLAASIWISHQLQSSYHRSVWEVAPEVLIADRGEPAECVKRDGACARLPVLAAISGVREASASRLGVGDLIRNCARDQLLAPPPVPERPRICFVTTQWPWPHEKGPIPHTTDDACCKAQGVMLETVNDWYRKDQRTSWTAEAHKWLLWMKVFFVLNLVAISVLLVWRNKLIVEHYPQWIDRVERGLLIGMMASMFLPFMSQAFVLSWEALVGTIGRGTFGAITPLLIGTFGVCTLLILLFFYQREDRSSELFAKLLGAAASMLAVMKYDLVVDLFVRGFNAGADWRTLTGLVIACVLAAAAVVHSWNAEPRKPRRRAATVVRDPDAFDTTERQRDERPSGWRG